MKGITTTLIIACMAVILAFPLSTRFAFVAYAEGEETHETASETEPPENEPVVQDVQTEAEEPARSELEPAGDDVQVEQNDVEPVTGDEGAEIYGSEINAGTDLSNSPVYSSEQIEAEQGDASDISADDDYSVQTIAKLESIDYNLRVISGGVVLTLCCLFIWITVLKPIKGFADF